MGQESKNSLAGSLLRVSQNAVKVSAGVDILSEIAGTLYNSH